MTSERLGRLFVALPTSSAGPWRPGTRRPMSDGTCSRRDRRPLTAATPCGRARAAVRGSSGKSMAGCRTRFAGYWSTSAYARRGGIGTGTVVDCWSVVSCRSADKVRLGVPTRRIPAPILADTSTGISVKCAVCGFNRQPVRLRVIRGPHPGRDRRQFRSQPGLIAQSKSTTYGCSIKQVCTPLGQLVRDLPVCWKTGAICEVLLSSGLAGPRTGLRAKVAGGRAHMLARKASLVPGRVSTAATVRQKGEAHAAALWFHAH